MTKESELRAAAVEALTIFEGALPDDANAIRALIAHLDRKCERAFEAGRLMMAKRYDKDRYSSYREWNESQRGKDDDGK